MIPATGFRSYPFGGGLLQRELSKKLSLATEVFYHGQATNATRFSTMLDAGGSYRFHGDDSFQLLFCYGHSVAGQSETYAYVGLYWTWGKDSADVATKAQGMRLPPFSQAGLRH